MTPPIEQAPVSGRTENQTPTETVEKNASLSMVADAYHGLQTEKEKASDSSLTGSLRLPNLRLIDDHPTASDKAMPTAFNQYVKDESGRFSSFDKLSSEEIRRLFRKPDSDSVQRPQNNVIQSAVELLSEHPEYKDRIKYAKLIASMSQDDSHLLSTIGDIASTDKEMGRALKEQAYSGLSSMSDERRVTAAKLLNAVAETWTADDARLAATHVTPDTMSAYQSALARMPQKAREQVLHDLLIAIGNGPLNNRDQRVFAAVLSQPPRSGLLSAGETFNQPNDFTPPYKAADFEHLIPFLSPQNPYLDQIKKTSD